MKITAQLYETFDGSDDPRAIQGGGEKLSETRTNSPYLIVAYVKAYENRYGERLLVRRIK